MAVLSETYRYLFIHSPRTGGTALTHTVLLPQLGGTRLPSEPMEVAHPKHTVRTVGKHATRSQLIAAGLLTEELAAGLFTFTAVRNPFDSLVSSYVKRSVTVVDKPWTARPEQQTRMALAAESSFPEYLERMFDEHGRPRHLYGAQIDDADFVMRFETLQDDFDKVVTRLGVLRRIEIGRTNVTPGRDPDYRRYYTPEARALVERVFAPDLERFGYEY